MTPAQLYSLEPINVITDNLNKIFRVFQEEARQYDIPSVFAIDVSYELIEKMESEKRLTLHQYMSEGDDKYGGELEAIYFDGIPIGVVKTSGRYYEDFEFVLTNESQLKLAEKYVHEHIGDIAENKRAIYDPESDIIGLEIVADYNLFDFYDANLDSLYKLDDVVWAWVPENHLKYSFADDYKGYILTKVKITEVSKFNPEYTYFGYLQEYGFNEERKLALNMKGGIGCSLNDFKIVGLVSEIPMPEQAVNNIVDENGYVPDNYKYLLPERKKKVSPK